MRLAELRSALPLALILGMLAGPDAHAQRRQFGPRITVEPNLPYDGRFTFARIRYAEFGRGGWQFDYPQMERNFLTMMRELTTLRPHVEGSNVHTLDDPALLRYPVAYLSEPGYWLPSEAEVEGLRNYLKKGGFLFDVIFRIPSLDMKYPHNPNLAAEFLGIHEDNDPSRPLMVVINYNNDIGDYMEWSGHGWWAVNITNDAYKLAVNYIIYGMTR
jgi:hypothetical protein